MSLYSTSPTSGAVLTAVLALLLNACGQLGPLYQPPPEPADEESAAAPERP